MSDIKRMREMTRKEWRQEEVSGGLSFIGGEGIDVTSFWPPTHFDISLWRVGALTLIPPFLFAVPTTLFNIFLLFLHLCSWCFATYLPWRDVVRLKSLMISRCFRNWKDCLGANSDAPRNCSMYNTRQRHVVRIPHVAMDHPGLPLTSGWNRATVLQAHLMLLDLCVLLLQHYFDTLCVHLLDYFKPSVTKGKQSAYCKQFLKMVSTWLRMKNWSTG